MLPCHGGQFACEGHGMPWMLVSYACMLFLCIIIVVLSSPRSFKLAHAIATHPRAQILGPPRSPEKIVKIEAQQVGGCGPVQWAT